MRITAPRLLFFSAAFAGLMFEPGPVPAREIQSAANPAPFQRVEIRDTERRFLTSKHVDQTYEIDVWFPKDYYGETARYPVIYVLDAEYNFGCVSYIAKRLIKNGDIPKVLVVGIAYNTDEDDFYAKRERNSTPPFGCLILWFNSRSCRQAEGKIRFQGHWRAAFIELTGNK